MIVTGHLRDICLQVFVELHRREESEKVCERGKRVKDGENARAEDVHR